MYKRTYTSAPADFPVCTLAECKQAANCLRRTAYAAQAEAGNLLYVVNPSVCNAEGECGFFRSAEPLRYARGFLGMQQNMLPPQYARFKQILCRKYCDCRFYAMRRGTALISPTEQETICEALREVGITEPLTFDSYTDIPNWDD